MTLSEGAYNILLTQRKAERGQRKAEEEKVNGIVGAFPVCLPKSVDIAVVFSEEEDSVAIGVHGGVDNCGSGILPLSRRVCPMNDHGRNNILPLSPEGDIP